ncbi:polysaccharide pyruvyl transferase family protein [Leptothermofonsia sp. ETS-13]|uniref:polysaccharide pyruvyl transferase family protein n=1 Tax=Leptothermofonsia sp. ETS-13 TaxID=3035696 RepID=UPI003BA1EDDB
MKVFFVNDTSDSKNWGCRATTGALRRMVNETGIVDITHTLYLKRMSLSERYISSNFKEIEDIFTSIFEHLPTGKSLTRYVQQRWIGPRWNRIAGARDVIPNFFEEFPIFAQKMLSGEILQLERKALEECDLVFINGEGSIYDRQRKGRMMLFIAYLAKVHFGKPCVLANHTADVHDPIMAEMVAQVYPLLDDVIFREPLSAEACQAFVREDNSALAADAAFTYQPVEKTLLASLGSRDGYFSIHPDSASGFNPSQPYICVGGSSIYLRRDRPSYDPIPGFKILCEKLRQYVAPVVLTAPDPVDEKIFRPIAQELNLPLISLTTPTQQAVDILGNADVYISGRWHPSILALTGGTPIVTFTANTYKTQALVQQMGLDAPTFDALNLHKEAGDVVDLAKFYLDQGESLRSKIRSQAEMMAQLAQKNVRYLKNQL